MRLKPITLRETIELSEITSKQVRENIINSEKGFSNKNAFVQVIFNQSIQIVLSICYPACNLISFEIDRLKNILGESPPEDIKDKLKNISYLRCLDDSQIKEIKQMFNIHFLDELKDRVVFPEKGLYCLKKHMSRLSKRIIPINKLPNNENYFCWLQILPLVRAYPTKFIPTLEQEFEIHNMIFFTKECSIIHEELNTSKLGSNYFTIHLLPTKVDDIHSILFENESEFDIRCALTSCERLLEKIEKKNSESYRYRFIKFIVKDPKAGLPYLAKKLYNELQNNNTYLWYK